jgi:hypothetical protein
MTESLFTLSSQPAIGGTPFVQLMSTPRFQFLLLLTLATFLYTLKLDNGGIMAYDECFYAQKAKEMVTSGDWLTQRIEGKPNHLNPWLHMWVIACSYKVFGVSEWAARFPTCVEAILTVLLTYLLAQWICNAPFFGLLSASMLLGNDFFFRFAQKAHMDHLVTLLFLAAIIMYLLGQKKNRMWFLGMGAAIGLAILTKSILGLFPLMVIVAHLLVMRNWRVVRHPMFIVSVALAIAIGSTWYGYEYVHFKEQFLHYHFGSLIYSHSILNDVSRGTTTFVGFLSMTMRSVYGFILNAHVWLALAVAGLALSRFKPAGNGCRITMHTEEWTLLALWLLIPPAVLAVAGGFKGWYLMPVYVPMAIFGACFFYRIFPKAEQLCRVDVVILSLVLAYLSILIITPRFTLDLKHELRHPGIRKLATKVRMLDLEPGMRVVYFPATEEIAMQHGMQTALHSAFFGHSSIALPWVFYSDHPLFERSAAASLEETRRYMDLRDGVCLTTDEGFGVISEQGRLPYEMMGRAQDTNVAYVICCSRKNFFRWRERIETDFSRPPLYDLRQY